MSALTRPEARGLERLFAREIDLALRRVSLPPTTSLGPKMAARLVEKGLVEHLEFTIEGRFPVRCQGYVLTHLGRYAYGAWAGEQVTDEELGDAEHG